MITSLPYRKALEEKPNASITNKVKKNLEIKTKKNTTKENEDTECFYCSHLYSEYNEGWVQCPICGFWTHCSCARVDDDDAETKFVCENCFMLCD